MNIKRFLPRLVPIYKVKVIYKSGATHTFKAVSFSYSGSRVEWKPYSDRNKPIFIGLDEIESVWQVGVSYALRFNHE